MKTVLLGLVVALEVIEVPHPFASQPFGLTAITVAAQRQGQAAAKTDAQTKDEIIRASIASYSGSCPCPYNVDRAGRSCGRRSAYSRPGGAAPLCYPQDVTQKMLDDYRAARGERRSAVAPARNGQST